MFAEVKPPWIKCPQHGPADGYWRQSGEIWFNDIWLAYFDEMTKSEQVAYLDRYSVPEEWVRLFFQPREIWKEYGFEMEERGQEIEPPWVKLPGIGPEDAYWKQSGLDIWIIDFWLPHFEKLSKKEQDAYLKRYDVPTDWGNSHYVLEADSHES